MFFRIAVEPNISNWGKNDYSECSEKCFWDEYYEI